MKWYEIIVLGFIGGMLFLWLRFRNAGLSATVGVGASNYAPVDTDSLFLSIGFVHSVDANAPECLIPQPMESRNDAIPLASDYLGYDPGYAAPISPCNLGSCDPAINCWTSEKVPVESTFAIGVVGPNSTPRPLKMTQQISCNPDIPTTVPDTCIV